MWANFGKQNWRRPLTSTSQHGKSLCSAVGSSWAGPLSTPQKATALISWKLDSTPSGQNTGLLSGPWYVLNATLLLSSATHANQLPNRSSHVSAKLPLSPNQENEDAPWLQPGTLPLYQSLNRLYTRSGVSILSIRDPAVAAQTPVSNLFLSQVAELMPSTLRRMPRLSEPGPLGMRAEHWYDFGEQVGDSNLFVHVVAHIAAAAVPHPVLQNFRSGQVTPLAKPTGGHRPLLMVSFLRRLALQSVVAAKKELVAKCAGPLQNHDQDHSVSRRS